MNVCFHILGDALVAAFFGLADEAPEKKAGVVSRIEFNLDNPEKESASTEELWVRKRDGYFRRAIQEVNDAWISLRANPNQRLNLLPKNPRLPR